MIRRNTKQRQEVLDIIQKHNRHFTADEVYACIHKKDAHISRGTVYRNLQILTDEEQIRRIRMPNTSDRYEWNMQEHDHLLCRECGKIVDIGPIHNSVDKLVKKQSGYTEIQHTILFTGICPECQKKQEPNKN